MLIVIVRTCETSQGRIVCEIPGGTQDREPMEFAELEARSLIAAGHARLPPPAPAVDPTPPAPAPVPEPAPAPEAPLIPTESQES